MAEHRLDVADVGPALQHQRRQGVLEPVTGTLLVCPGRLHVIADQLGSRSRLNGVPSTVRNNVPSSGSVANLVRTSDR